MKKCDFSNCKNYPKARGYCKYHYNTEYYNKTINGVIALHYRDMRKRVLGKGTTESSKRIYTGLKILPRDEFVSWSKSNKDLYRVHKEWVASGYDYKLSPSVDRVKRTEGYLSDNIQWIPHGLNCSLAAVSKNIKNKEKQVIYKVLGVKNEKSSKNK